MQDPCDGLSALDYPKLGTKLGQDGADSKVMKSDMRLQNEQFREAMGARKKQGVAFSSEVGTLQPAAEADRSIFQEGIVSRYF